MMKVSDVARIVGISVRTLHHYDDIGLLPPHVVSESGYRLYSETDLSALQQILFFKELGFPLKQIKEIMNNPQYNSLEALQFQRDMIKDKVIHYEQMLQTIDTTIQHMKGEVEMSAKDKFKGFQFDNNPFEEEARQKWGDQSVEESNQKLSQLSSNEKQQLADLFQDTFQQLAAIRHLDPASSRAQSGIQIWFEVLNRHFGTYTKEAFAGLGQMYVWDERFTQNIDQYGEGLAKFMSEAMTIYAEQSK